MPKLLTQVFLTIIRKYLTANLRFLTKVQQQSYFYFRCFQIIYQLKFVRLQQFVTSFLFKDNAIID